MGAFFTNVQVRINGVTPDQARIAVIDGLRRHLGSAYVESAGTEAPDRVVLVGPPRPGGWVGVYDEASESQDARVLESLASGLSGLLPASVVTILVHDSDVVDLRLFRDGKRVDTYVNNPEYFGEKLGRRKREQTAGHPDLWADLLLSPARPDDLRRAWSGDPLLAEEIVAATARLLGADESGATTGFKYLTTEQDTTAFRRLHFRLRERPPEERKAAAGPPRLELGAFTPQLEVSVGDDLRLSTSVRNVGGESRGLLVAAWGEAIEHGLATVERVTLSTGHRSGAAPGQMNRDERPFEPSQAEGRAVWMARFPEFPVAASPLTPGPGIPPERSARALEAMISAQTYVSVMGRVAAAGEGALHIGVAPLAHTKGQVAHSTEVLARPLRRQPLRFAKGRSQFLRQMDEPRILSALMVLAADPSAAAGAAEAVVTRWSDVLCPHGEGRYIVRLWESIAKKPRSLKLKAREIGKGRGWEELRGAFPRWLSVSATLDRKTEARAILDRFGSGFLFQAWAPGLGGNQAHCPQLALFTDLTDLAEDRREAAEGALGGIVDGLAGGQAFVQAFLARWAWAPMMTADSTLYELACGVNGQCTTTRDWSMRFLRAVTERLWLGADLLEKLGDGAALKQAAEVEVIGRAMRVALPRGADLGPLEQALAVLLPGESDWREGMQKLHVAR